MRAKEIMTRDAVFVSTETPIVEAAELIFQNRFHGLPVVEEGKVVGIVTEDDFFLKDQAQVFLPAYIQFLKENFSKEKLSPELEKKTQKIVSAQVKEIMSETVRTVSPEEDAEEVLKIIWETKFTSFPVVDEQKNLLGILTLSDILGMVRRGSSKMRAALAQNKENGLYDSIKNLRSLWKDEMIFVSRKNVRTWKGGAVIGIFLFFLTIFLWIFNEKNQSNCGLSERDSLPMACREFSYSEWEPCQADGTQRRQITSRKPANCEGGLPPIIVQKCLLEEIQN